MLEKQNNSNFPKIKCSSIHISTLARNGFCMYADEESSMVKNMQPDDDWDEEHIPQAFEIHNITNYPEIFKMFDIPLHIQFRGKGCIKEFADYLLKFDKRRKIVHHPHGNPDCLVCKKTTEDVVKMSFTEYIKAVNYTMNSTPEQEEKYNTTKDCYLCGQSINGNIDEDDEDIFQSDDDSIEKEFEEEAEHEELELALKIAGKRIAKFDERTLGTDIRVY